MTKRTLTSATLLLALFVPSALVATGTSAPSIASGFSQIPDTGFESGNLSGWTTSTLSGTKTVIDQDGRGVGVIVGSVDFVSPEFPEEPNCAPAVDAATWSFGPGGTTSAILQPNGDTFDAATVALELSSADNSAIRGVIIDQADTSGCGGANTVPSDAAWISKRVTLTAGLTYRMAWNYIGTDYVPYNDGSITSLVPLTGNASVMVNNRDGNYALLGFTNPGTGDYSTGHFGSTGWQYSTYQVSVTGDYLLGFAVFNLGDNALDPVLLVDDRLGSVTRNGQSFGAVVPNNEDAPSLVAPEAESSPATPAALSAPSTALAATGPGDQGDQILVMALLLTLSGVVLIYYSRLNPQGRKRNRLYWEGS